MMEERVARQVERVEQEKEKRRVKEMDRVAQEREKRLAREKRLEERLSREMNRLHLNAGGRRDCETGLANLDGTETQRGESMLDSYDRETGIATLHVNTFFPGFDFDSLEKWTSQGLTVTRASGRQVRVRGSLAQLEGTSLSRRARRVHEEDLERLKSERFATDPDVVMEQWASRVAAVGTPIDSAIESVWHTGPAMCAGARRFNDSFRPLGVRLARKFMTPNEQLLAAFEVLPLYSKKPMALVVFTNGFAVKAGGRTFRTEPEVRFIDRPRFAGDDNPPQSTEVRLGEFKVRGDVEEGHDLPYILRLQRELQQRQQAAATERRTARPPLRLIRSARDAELVTAEWMTYMGFANVQTTAVGADGGVDVLSDEAVAQVKAEMKPVGRPAVQQHHGVATAHEKEALFFSLAGYTSEAQIFAHDHGTALFTFDLQGEPEAVNTKAHDLLGGAR